MANIVLIGMPGCGKSTVGALLAAALHMDFVDTDIVLQEQQGKKLQTIIDAVGNDAFLKIEEDCICGLEYNNTVIATGGSVVYGKKAMRHLHENGLVVYIRLPYEEIERRLSNPVVRSGSGLCFRCRKRRRRKNCARFGRSTVRSFGGKR